MAVAGSDGMGGHGRTMAEGLLALQPLRPSGCAAEGCGDMGGIRRRTNRSTRR